LCHAQSVQLASDNFQRPPSNPMSGNWTPESTNSADGYTTNQIMTVGLAEQVFVSANNLSGYSYWNATVPPNAQYAEVTLASIGSAGTGSVGVSLRMGAEGAETSYDLYVLEFDSTHYDAIIQVTAGAVSTILVENEVMGTPTAGDIIRGEAKGSTLNLYYNGTLVATVADTTYTSGYFGIYEYGAVVADAAISAWDAGGFLSVEISGGELDGGLAR